MKMFGGDRPHAGAEHQAGRDVGLLGRRGARLAQGLVEQILEHRALPLEAVGADVGKIVGDHVELGLLGIEAGLAYPEGADHRSGRRFATS